MKISLPMQYRNWLCSLQIYPSFLKVKPYRELDCFLHQIIVRKTLLDRSALMIWLRLFWPHVMRILRT